MYDELKDYKESETKAKEYKTGIFEETKRINVGCDYGGFDIFNSARAESIDVEATPPCLICSGGANQWKL